MTIVTLDTYSDMRDILTAPLADRPQLLEQMLAPVAGMYRHFPGKVDLVSMHHMGSGFRVDRYDDRAIAGLEALREASAWSRIDAALHDALAVPTRGDAGHRCARHPGGHRSRRSGRRPLRGRQSTSVRRKVAATIRVPNCEPGAG